MDLINDEGYKNWVRNLPMFCISDIVEDLFKYRECFFEEVENIYICPDCGKSCLDESLECQNHSEDYFSEPLEWWLVTNDLFELLRELKEPVIDYGDSKIWGRCCSGQLVECDYTMQEAYKLLLNQCK